MDIEMIILGGKELKADDPKTYRAFMKDLEGLICVSFPDIGYGISTTDRDLHPDKPIL